MTSTEICNLALGRLGESRILNLSEDTSQARAAHLNYDPCRREVLRSHRWNFALKRMLLVESSETPAFGWAHQFPLPGDCLRVLDDECSDEGDMISSPYVVEGRMVLTNQDSFRLVYVRDVEDTTQFDPLFVQALAVFLAAKLSEFLRGSSDKSGELLEEYAKLTGPIARRVDANEGRKRRGMLPVNSMFVRSRGGWPSGFVYTHDLEVIE